MTQLIDKRTLNTKLTQLIDRRTQIAPTSAALLDLTITNKPEIVIHSATTPCHVGDHELISITLDLYKKSQPVTKTFR